MGGEVSGRGNPAWQKGGKSPNPNGRPKKDTTFTDILKQYGETKITGDLQWKHALAKVVWEAALKNKDLVAAKFIFDRTEGPVANINKNININDFIELEESEEFIKTDLLRLKQFIDPWYKPAWYHREIAENLQNSDVKKLIVTLPPQHGKSEVLVKTFPAYFLGNNPDKSVIVASYNQEYVNKLSVKCRDFFDHPKFKKLYGLELHPDQQTKHEWLIKDHNGGAVFAGVGGSITGNPADILLIDDVTKDMENASSKTHQEMIWDWYNSVVGTRLQGDDSRIIIIMTRWMKNDLIGKILKQEEADNTPTEKRFKVLHYPAILGDLGPDGNDFEKGRPLWPEKKSMDFLLDRAKSSRSIFKTMWQGNPKDLEGTVIKPDWIKIENDIESLGQRILSCRGWDFGYTESGNATVGARIDVFQNGELVTPILMDVVLCRKDPTAVKEFLIETAMNDGVDTTIAVESGGTQLAMAKDIIRRKELMDFSVRTFEPRAIKGSPGQKDQKIINNNKIARAISWILKLEDGLFRLAPGKWNKEVIDSLVDFSDTCDEDDIEDAITVSWKTLFGVNQ